MDTLVLFGNWRIVVTLTLILTVIDSIPMISLARKNSNPLVARMLRDETFMKKNRQQATQNFVGFTLMF